MPERTRAESRRAALDDLAKILELNEPILRASLPEESHDRLPKAQSPSQVPYGASSQFSRTISRRLIGTPTCRYASGTTTTMSSPSAVLPEPYRRFANCWKRFLEAFTPSSWWFCIAPCSAKASFNIYCPAARSCGLRLLAHIRSFVMGYATLGTRAIISWWDLG